MSSSDAFLPCRLDWRRSRWLPAALCVLAGLASLALWLSELPRPACIAATVVIVAYAALLLLRELRREPCTLTWSGGDTDWQLMAGDRTESLRHVNATIRGGLVVLTLADSSQRTCRYVWWPDTLDLRSRRALRLALSVRPDATTPTQPTLAQ